MSARPLVSAGLFLSYASARNRLRRMVKKPKVLVFTLLGFSSMIASNARLLFRGLSTKGRPTDPLVLPHGAVALTSLGFAGLALLVIAATWLFGGSKVALQYTEAEVAFLFSGPVTRRELIHYKLVRALFGSALIAPLFALLSGRGEHPTLRALGIFFVLSTFALHRVASSFTRVSLLEHGVSGLRRRVVTFALLMATFGFFALVFVETATSLPRPDGLHLQAWVAALAAWASAHEAAISWSLLPLAAPVRLMSARSAFDVLISLPVAVAVLAAHYAWAVSSGVAFEETAAEDAQTRARSRAATRSGTARVGRHAPLFTLAAAGRPWVALLWKNLSLSGGMSGQGLRLMLFAFLLGPLPVIYAFRNHRHDGLAQGTVFLLGGLAFVLSVIGPMVARSDLRGDVEKMEVLRSYPLTGREVLLGSIASPLLLLSAMEAATILLAEVVAIAVGRPGQIGRTIAAGVAALFVLPALTACGVVLQNLLVLHFPSWAKPGEVEAGVEASGRRLVHLLAAIVMLAIVVGPALLTMVVAVLVFTPLFGGHAAIALGGALAAGVAAAEAYLGMVLAARAFDAFDVTEIT